MKSLKESFRRVLKNIEMHNHIKKGYAQVIYSQQGEDLEINRLLAGVNRGFYVDVGAFHPFKYSNTFALYQRGWRGINIEPNPEQAELFRLYRKEDINLNIGVSGKKAVLKYYSFNGAAVNTFVEANASTWADVKGFEIKSIEEIQTEPLKIILEKYLPDGKQINLMNIDVEGMDMEVLKSNDWSEYRPQIILVEEAWYNKNSLQESDVYQFLNEQNYILCNIVGITMFFKDKQPPRLLA